MDNTPNRSAWLKGPAFPCEPQPPARARPLRLALLGPPGVGKGTQAELLATQRGACHLSTGDVLRTAKASDPYSRTPALEDAITCMTHGQLVSDGTVLELVRERVACLRCQGGFLLDGFPRTVPQAAALDALLASEGIPLDAVIAFEMDLERLVQRIAGRRTCARCHAVYHVEAKPPAQPGICDRCGGELLQRDDDRPETTRVRMRAYTTNTAPLLDYYRTRGVLLPVPAEGRPAEVFSSASDALDRRLAEHGIIAPHVEAAAPGPA